MEASNKKLQVHDDDKPEVKHHVSHGHMSVCDVDTSEWLGTVRQPLMSTLWCRRKTEKCSF